VPSSKQTYDARKPSRIASCHARGRSAPADQVPTNMVGTRQFGKQQFFHRRRSERLSGLLLVGRDKNSSELFIAPTVNDSEGTNCWFHPDVRCTVAKWARDVQFLPRDVRFQAEARLASTAEVKRIPSLGRRSRAAKVGKDFPRRLLRRLRTDSFQPRSLNCGHPRWRWQRRDRAHSGPFRTPFVDG
jgi:hypothetical protein